MNQLPKQINLKRFEPNKITTSRPENTNEATREHWHVLRVERFKNLGRQSQIAEKPEQMAKEKLEI